MIAFFFQNANKSTMAHSTKHCVTESVQCIILGGSLSPAISKEVTGNRKNCLINVKLIDKVSMKRAP